MGAVTVGSRIILDLVPPRGSFGDSARERGAPRGWDLLGNVPVPLRHRVLDGIENLVTGHRATGGPPLKCCFPMGQGGRGPFERLRFIRALDDYPDMLVSAEHGNAFNRRFHARHVETGAFTGAQPESVAPVFAEAGLVDPKGWIGVFAVAPFVLLIDRRRLDGLPVPRRWADLMDPVYRGQVVFGGWRGEGERRYSQFNTFFPLAMAREFGMGGLARLLANVPSLLHSAQMPRLAGTGSSPGGIYVLPWAQADMCPRRSHTEVVWPEDGALAYPLWLTVKAAERLRLDLLLRHFHGAGLGRYLNDNLYPALYPDLPPTLPAGARLKWPGWEFVRHAGTAPLVKAVRRAVTDSLEARPCA